MGLASRPQASEPHGTAVLACFHSCVFRRPTARSLSVHMDVRVGLRFQLSFVLKRNLLTAECVSPSDHPHPPPPRARTTLFRDLSRGEAACHTLGP